MKVIRRLYEYILLFALLVIVVGQLIWLPAPLFNGASVEWIEVIDSLFYMLLIIPLSILLISVIVFKHYSKIRLSRAKRVSLMLFYMVQVCIALISCYAIGSQHLAMTAISLAILLIISAVQATVLHIAYKWLTYKQMLIRLISYVIGFTLLICPIPYTVIHPVFTFNLENYAQLAHSQHYQIGKIDGVLVADRPAFVADIIYTKLFQSIELKKREKSQQPINVQYSQVVMQKDSSNELAEAYAWQYFSGEQVILSNGVLITGVLEDSTANGILRPGETIVAINEAAIETVFDLNEAMSTISIGDSVVVHVLDEQGQRHTAIVKSYASAEDAKKARLGIYIQQSVEMKEPLEVKYKDYIAHFGGPSHGAMLTIALLNYLYEGKLVGNHHIAGTGTIEVDGTIGMVGGIAQKAYAVNRSGAEVFFVPQEAVELAKSVAPTLNVVGVTHIDDIVKWLEFAK